MTGQDIEALSPFQRVVLLAVVELRAREDAPVHSFDVTGVCEDLRAEFEALDEVLQGGVTRQRVISALGDLEEAGHLGTETKESPTGKGRPAYSITVDERDVVEALADDDRFATAAERVRDEYL
ncbi:MAG: hypothetical protein ABEJ30_01200 [Halorientalis sp.]